MSPSRREFLELGSLVMVATAVPLAPQANASVRADAGSDTALYHTSAESMQKHVGSEFAIDRVGTSRVRMLLEAVKEFPRPAKSAAGDCFAMHFRLTEGNTLPEGLYHMDHAAFGRTALFVAPIDERGLTYSAVINHRKA